jgi:hypothetical protein
VELTKSEVVAVEKLVAERAEAACQELSAIELALVGGGCGIVEFG